MITIVRKRKDRASVSVMPLSTHLNLGLGELAHTKLTVKLADRTVKYPKRIAKNVLVGIGKFVFPVDFIILDMPGDVKVPLILERPFLSTAHAKIDVFKRKITLRVGDEKIIFKSVKPASSLIKRVYMLSLKEKMKLDLEAKLTGETLVINRSLDPLYEDYIELNDLNVPLELRRDQVDNLMPTIKGVNRVGEFYNSIMRDKVEHKGKNVVGAFMNVPIFVGKFSIVTHFVVVENMDGYRDQGMGDIILGEPFCKASCVEARRFDGLITIHNGSDNVTYQMARSHPRFKHLSNVKCSKIKPLLKDLAAKKSTKLMKYRSSGILCLRKKYRLSFKNDMPPRDKPYKEEDIEQQLQDSTKGTMQTLHTKNEGNLWKKPRASLLVNQRRDMKKNTTWLKKSELQRMLPYAVAELGASVSMMPLLTYLNLGISKFIFPVDFIILDMPEDVRVPLILKRPFLSTAHAKFDVFRRKITLRWKIWMATEIKTWEILLSKNRSAKLHVWKQEGVKKKYRLSIKNDMPPRDK
nr:hypothetical protein [Tanacetum cinerariifolium]